MRAELQQAIDRFLKRDLPTDAEYYQQRREEVAALVDTLEQHTGRHISWEPPVDLFNFYHLQIPLHTEAQAAPLYGKSIALLRRLSAKGGSSSFLHVLVSVFSRWLCIYWERHRRNKRDFEVIYTIADTTENLDEQTLLAQVKHVLDEQGWLILTPEEGAKVVPDAAPIWPERSQSPSVRHILFPGCASLID